MPTDWKLTKEFPTRYAAHADPGSWYALDVDWSTVPPPQNGQVRDARWTEMAVYSNPRTGLHATVRRLPFPIDPEQFEYAADVFRDGHGEIVLARDFPEAVRLASEWLGLT